MALPSLRITIQNSAQQIDKLHAHQIDCEKLEAKYQHFIGEMIMLRLFSIFEDTVAELAYKVAAGGLYLDGSSANLIKRAGRTQDARYLFLTYNRPKAKDNLKWTKAKFIRESINNIIPNNESFIINTQAHGQIIDEMRKVRNALAHNSPSAKSEFKDVLRVIYGFNKNISPGVFLISKRHHNICNLTRYISSTKIVLQTIAGGV
ncbi:hypothetical protein ASE80_00965 [Pseudomonas sp. Leaf15]|uniref:hypothetical protein n=1 Tax=unclassified Pseudomonas TaxID=196821 RepID=UPI0007034FA4|nr:MULTISPECIES: hypothetical protein [unclassified Pseudomonas]KQM55655.1 hypothetical protein ASE80_00965 [Pseudomonas sp. Leaf15]RAH03965.1 hypothetical protein DJ480_05870 [Pseudomonas sp. Leaf98]